MRPLLTQEDGLQLLRPHFEKFVEIMQGVFQPYQEINAITNYDGSMVELTQSTPSIIFDLICSALMSTYTDHPDIEPGVIKDNFCLYFKNKAFVKVNKLNEDLYPISNRSSKTDRQKRIAKQLPIFSDVEVTYVTLGYVPDESWTGLKGVYIVCWLGKINLWTIDLLEKQSLEQTQFNFNTETEALTPRVSIKEDVISAQKKAE
jgi:hypothetical protein